jgi:hypothetical protein
MTDPESLLALEDLVSGCLAALDDEVDAVREDLARRGIAEPLAARSGREADADGASLLYDWDLPPGRYLIRPDDAVRIECEAGESLGFVTAFRADGPRVRISAGDWLGRHPGPARLAFDPSWLLETLAGRLEGLADEPEAFHPETALRLLGRKFPPTGVAEPLPAAAADLNPSQQAALLRLIGSAVQFVWGPPGTGKTRLLGYAAAELAADGRVLVLAMTNVAVDEAADRAARVLGPSAVEAGRVVRVGAEFSSTGDAELSLEAAVERAERRQPSRLGRTLADLENELLVLPRRNGDRTSLRARYGRLLSAARDASDASALGRLGRLAGEFQRAAARAIGRADVVLTTFARLTVRDDLASQRFRSLIIDEASTAPLPYVLFSAALARERAIAVGDFQQLPAVVASRSDRARRWLRRDVFREAGIVGLDSGSRDLPSPHDALCSMLVEQYRMRPAIRSMVSDLFYGGRLTDAPEVSERADGGPALGLVDTTSLSPRVERAEGSRGNPVHAEVILQLLELLAREGAADVGLVTPYRLQARRLATTVRGRLGQAAPRGLEISTIHRFQGREKAVMILDTVDAPPHGSWFLDERKNEDFPRLLNVALSRSRNLLVVVGAVQSLRAALAPDSLLNQVLERIRASGVVVDGVRLAAQFGCR